MQSFADLFRGDHPSWLPRVEKWDPRGALNRSHTILISRNSRTQALGARKWEANSRSISSGRQ